MINKASAHDDDLARSAGSLQRTSGQGRLETLWDGRQTRIATLYQEGAAKIRMPRQHLRQGHLDTVIINTAGGLTGGDHLTWRLGCAAGGSLTVTTQACEKIYKSSGGNARVETSLSVGPGGSLLWLPQETILFDRGRLSRHIEVELATDSSFLMVEAYVLGRKARGERVDHGHIDDRWRVSCEGRLVHREDLRLTGDVDTQICRQAILSGGVAFATVLLVAPDALDRLEQVRGHAVRAPDSLLGISAWPVAGTGKLLARISATDGYNLRKRLIPLLEQLAGDAPVPKIWSL